MMCLFKYRTEKCLKSRANVEMTICPKKVFFYFIIYLIIKFSVDFEE